MHQRDQWRRGRAFGSGPAVVLAGCLLSGCTAPASPQPGQGSTPAFLREVSAPPDHQTSDGSAEHPAIVSQGDAVRVHLRAAVLQARVTGPATGPATGAGHTLRTRCTWTVELTQATAPVPLDLTRFLISDTGAHAYHPVLAAGDPPLPRSLLPGSTLRFHLQATLPNGEAILRWAPQDDTIPASWDFTVEND